MKRNVKVPKAMKANACKKKTCLLVGMVNSRVELGNAKRQGQLERDGRRCDALERHGETFHVLSLDTNHEPDDVFVKPGRHFQGNISDYRRLRRSFVACESFVRLQYIFIDYIHMPPCYIESILSDKFFNQTLTGLVLDGFLTLQGEIWIPNIGNCRELMSQHETVLKKYFTWELIKNPMSNLLYSATETINDDLELLSDMCSNRNGTGNIREAEGGSFFKLTRIR